MAWVKFTADHDHRAGQATIAYKAGWTGNVPTAHVDAAVAAGKAVRLRKVRKGEEAELVDAVYNADSEASVHLRVR